VVIYAKSKERGGGKEKPVGISEKAANLGNTKKNNRAGRGKSGLSPKRNGPKKKKGVKRIPQNVKNKTKKKKRGGFLEGQKGINAELTKLGVRKDGGRPGGYGPQKVHHAKKGKLKKTGVKRNQPPKTGLHCLKNSGKVEQRI